MCGRIYAIHIRRSNGEFSETPTRNAFSEIGDHWIKKSTSIFGGFEMSAFCWKQYVKHKPMLECESQ